MRKRVRPGYEDPLEDIPAPIREMFEPADIPKMFDFMEERYHLSREWRKQFQEELKKQAKDLPDQAYFFKWANHYLNGSLAHIVYRSGADIIDEIALYLLRDRIAEKKREAEAQYKYYRR